MSLLYEITFRDILGNSIFIGIDDSEHAPGNELEMILAGDDPLIIECDSNNDDINSTIITTTARLKLVNTSENQYSDFYTTNPNRYALRAYIGNDQIFFGKLIAENYTDIEAKAPYITEVVFTDGLAALKEIDFLDDDGESYNEDVKTLLEILFICIKKTGINYRIYDASDIFEDQLSVSYSPLSQLYVECRIFDGMNCYDVIDEILKRFNYRMIACLGKIMIKRVALHAVAGSYATLQYSESNGFLTLLNSKSLDNYFETNQLTGKGMCRVPSGSVINFNKGINSIIINQDYNPKLANDCDFPLIDSVGLTLVPNWQNHSSHAVWESVYLTGNTYKQRANLTSSKVYTDYYAVTTKTSSRGSNVTITESGQYAMQLKYNSSISSYVSRLLGLYTPHDDQKISVSFNFKCSWPYYSENVTFRFVVQFYVDPYNIYYLGTDGEWKKQTDPIILTYDIPHEKDIEYDLLTPPLEGETKGSLWIRVYDTHITTTRYWTPSIYLTGIFVGIDYSEIAEGLSIAVEANNYYTRNTSVDYIIGDIPDQPNSNLMYMGGLYRDMNKQHLTKLWFTSTDESQESLNILTGEELAYALSKHRKLLNTDLITDIFRPWKGIKHGVDYFLLNRISAWNIKQCRVNAEIIQCIS